MQNKNKKIFLFLIISFLISGAPSQAFPNFPKLLKKEKKTTTIITNNKLRSQLISLPLSFEPNKGQADSEEIKFISKGYNYNLFLTPTKSLLSLTNNSKSSIIEVSLLNSNKNPKIKSLNKLSGIANYIIGNNEKDWKINIPTYSKVKYENIYDGIDLIYYGNQGRLEYDFIVSPKADPQNIVLQYDGVKNLKIDNGNLVIETQSGNVTQLKPYIYQKINGKNTEVEGKFVLRENNKVGFKLAKYERSKSIIIDPVIDFSTYFGNGSATTGVDIELDPDGNIYITGSDGNLKINGNKFPITEDAIQESFSDDKPPTENIFLTKLSNDGSKILYSTIIGGNKKDTVSAIAIDSLGFPYITGFTKSDNFPTTLSSFKPNLLIIGEPKAFVTKLSKDGTSLNYSTVFGTGKAFDIAVDGSGQACITGSTDATKFPLANPAQDTIANGFFDCFGSGCNPNPSAFVTKINSQGSDLVFSTYLGGFDDDIGSGIAVDPDGKIYVSGTTQNVSNQEDFPTTLSPYKNPVGSTSIGNNDFFITKYTPNGSVVYSVTIGGKESDADSKPFPPVKIAADSNGNAYIAGSTIANDFPVTENAFQKSLKGTRDIFVTKLDPTGSALIFSTYIGGSNDGSSIFNKDSLADIKVDKNGNAYIFGRTGADDFPLKNELQSKSGFQDAIIVKLTKNGDNLLFSSFYGGSGTENAGGIEVDNNGKIFIVGDTNSSDFPIKFPIQEKKLGNSLNVYVAKVDVSDLSEETNSLSNQSECDEEPEICANKGFCNNHPEECENKKKCTENPELCRRIFCHRHPVLCLIDEACEVQSKSLVCTNREQCKENSDLCKEEIEAFCKNHSERCEEIKFCSNHPKECARRKVCQRNPEECRKKFCERNLEQCKNEELCGQHPDECNQVDFCKEQPEKCAKEKICQEKPEECEKLNFCREHPEICIEEEFCKKHPEECEKKDEATKSACELNPDSLECICLKNPTDQRCVETAPTLCPTNLIPNPNFQEGSVECVCPEGLPVIEINGFCVSQCASGNTINLAGSLKDAPLVCTPF